jgi:hypothetical protein
LLVARVAHACNGIGMTSSDRSAVRQVHPNAHGAGLVAIALVSDEPSLFFPASLIIVGAYYLVFVSLYGMKAYA